MDAMARRKNPNPCREPNPGRPVRSLYMLAQYKQKCLNRISRVEDITYPKQLREYRPIGRRPGQTTKALLDGYSREAIYWPNFVTRRRYTRFTHAAMWDVPISNLGSMTG